MTSFEIIQRIIRQLHDVSQHGSSYQAKCPAHDDKKASLTISVGDTGNVILHCHANCETEDILSKLGMTINDLFVKETIPSKTISAVYQYTDVDKKVLYEVVRYEPKDFRQRVPDGNGGYTWSMKGVDRVLYNLPLVKWAINNEKIIFICEGEKDCDNLKAIKCPATTNAGGAEKWQSSYNEALRYGYVVILPDNDEPGRKHANLVAAQLYGITQTVTIVNLPNLPAKGDVSDWLATGRTADDLMKIVLRSEPWKPGIPEPQNFEEPFEFRLTQASNARYFAQEHGENVRYVPTMKKWVIWNEKIWEVDQHGKVRTLVEQTIRDMRNTINDIKDMKQAEAMLRHIRGSLSASNIDAAMSLASTNNGLSIDGEELDKDDWKLCCKNGMVDLKTSVLHPFSKTDMVTKSTSVAYSGMASAPRWEQFLAEVFDGDMELISFVQKALGYTLTGSTREHVYFMLYGGGSNGKSTLLNVITDILEDYQCKTSTETFLAKPNPSGATSDLARLEGMRFVSSVEAGPSRRMAEELVKEITGGDRVCCRNLYCDPHEYTPKLKLWLACNHKPIIEGQDEGIWRRIRFIPFNVEFAVPGAACGPYRDTTLKDQLREEYEGILNWMVKGCLRWQREGLEQCDAVKVSTDEYRSEQDMLAEFIETRCYVGPDLRCGSTTLYNAYKGWCMTEGIAKPWTQRMFSMRLTDNRRYKKRRSGVNGSREYYGIAVRDIENMAFGDE